MEKAQVLGKANVIRALETLHKNFVLVPIDQASNNVAVVCKKFYLEVILRGTGKIGRPNETYIDEGKQR